MEQCIGVVDVQGWKGKNTEISIVDETPEYYLLNEYRKANATSKPEPIPSKAYKIYIEILEQVLQDKEYREEIQITYVFGKLFDRYHNILIKEFPAWDTYDFKMKKRLWIGDRRTGDDSTYFKLYYRPVQYLCATGKLINTGKKLMRIQ